MKGAQARMLIEESGLTHEGIARLLELRRETVTRWCAREELKGAERAQVEWALGQVQERRVGEVSWALEARMLTSMWSLEHEHQTHPCPPADAARILSLWESWARTRTMQREYDLIVGVTEVLGLLLGRSQADRTELVGRMRQVVGEAVTAIVPLLSELAQEFESHEQRTSVPDPGQVDGVAQAGKLDAWALKLREVLSRAPSGDSVFMEPAMRGLREELARLEAGAESWRRAVSTRDVEVRLSRSFEVGRLRQEAQSRFDKIADAQWRRHIDDLHTSGGFMRRPLEAVLAELLAQGLELECRAGVLARSGGLVDGVDHET